ncbi:hypothetical protein E3P92_01907 [Wallemia ichthyophaga]|nr:hypothetical protein E3P92_01907 [Wallemia ichthyophaga]TIB41697.1 hypothetical protein E3P83_01686 [Wallemia ichthyophaga]
MLTPSYPLNSLSSKQAYTLEPLSGTGQSLTIDRATRELNLVNSPKDVHSDVDSVITLYGILGIIHLSTTPFLIAISDRELAGTINGCDVYRATDFKMFPIDRSSTLSEILKHPVDGVLLGLLKDHFRDGNFFFSHSFDVTSSLQRQQRHNQGPLHHRSDDRFFWNKFLQMPLLESELDLSKFILPVIYGFLEIKPTSIFGQPLSITLIARRCRYRAGTRYFSRGIDSHGNVSNFNETEQIVQIGNNTLYSHVQCRGSVPIYWSEINTLRYKPDLQIMDLPQITESLRLHLSSLVDHYGKVTCINLVNQKGYEKPVKEWFEAALDKIDHPNTDYLYFDFHSECSKMRWDRIQILIDRLDDDLKAQGYFKKDAQTVSNTQQSVFRTNCMDCLDRTNVVQSAVARVVLTAQLADANLIGPSDQLSDDIGFNYLFRNIWADHADAVSVTYSGTGALKTDFTRTGRRTLQGAFWDLVNSITRYIKNNYYDGSRQDAFDFVLGAWSPRVSNPRAVIKDDRSAITKAVPYVLTYSLLVLISGVVLPKERGRSLLTFYLLFSNLVALSSVYLVANGREYVAWPKLNPLDSIINYKGPGYRGAMHGRGFAWGVGSSGLRSQSASSVDEIEMGKKAS